MAQGVRMPFVRSFIVRMSCMRMHVKLPSNGRLRLPSLERNAMVSAMSNAMQLPPKRGPEQGRDQQGVQPNR